MAILGIDASNKVADTLVYGLDTLNRINPLMRDYVETMQTIANEMRNPAHSAHMRQMWGQELDSLIKGMKHTLRSAKGMSISENSIFALKTQLFYAEALNALHLVSIDVVNSDENNGWFLNRWAAVLKWESKALEATATLASLMNGEKGRLGYSRP